VLLKRWATLGLALCLGGCPDDEGPSPDAGAADATVDDGVTPPDIPWLAEGAPPVVSPSLTPCPEGWHEIAGDPIECRPYDEAGQRTCPDGEAHLPGETGCAPLGTACPAGAFAEGLPADGSVIFVDAAADPGGDGTMASPYGDVGEVPWSSLAGGTTVALAKGTYPGIIVIPPGVRVLGACVAETILVGGGTDPIDGAVAAITGGAPARLENVSIIDPPQRAIIARSGAELEVHGVLIRGAIFEGIDAYLRATIRVERVAIEDLRTMDGFATIGLRVDTAATMEADDVLIRGSVKTGVSVGGDGSMLRLRNAVIAGSEYDGLEVELGGSVDATGVLISGAGGGLEIEGEGTTAIASHLVLSDMTDGSLACIRVLDGAQLTTRQVVIAGAPPSGIGVTGAGTQLTAEDLVIRDFAGTGATPFAIGVLDGASFTGSRISIARRRGTMLALEDPGSHVELADVTIEEAESLDITPGLVTVQYGAELVAERMRISGISGNAMAIKDLGSARLTDVLIEDPAPSDDGAQGRGIQMIDEGVLEANRLVVVGAHEVALLAIGAGTRALVSDASFRDTRSSPTTGLLGRALTAQAGARLEGQRVVVEGSHELGIAATTGGVVELSDLRVSDVVAAECATTTCPSAPAGYGVAAVDGIMRLSRFEIRNSETCGVFIAPPASSLGSTAVDLMTGQVAECVIGACVQIDGYDLTRLSMDVVYRSNGTNLDVTSLPVPEPTDI
jgi:hypothetical protein